MSIGLLFLLKSKHSFPQAWLPFINDHERFRTFVHCYAEPDLTEWEPNVTIIPRVEGSDDAWGKLALFEIMLQLAKHAFETDENINFVYFLSDSCIPVDTKSSSLLYEKLNELSQNFTCSLFHQVSNGHLKRMQGLMGRTFRDKILTPEHNLKQSQWCGITRELGELMISLWSEIQTYWRAPGGGGQCPDEHFFIMFSSLFGLPYKSNMTTYVNWDDEESDHPKEYSTTDPLLEDLPIELEQDINRMRNKHPEHTLLFARKVKFIL